MRVVVGIGSAAMAGALAVTAEVGSTKFLVTVAALLVLLAAGWGALTQTPAPLVVSGLVVATSVAAITVVVKSGKGNPLPLLTLLVAGSVMATLGVQLIRRTRPDLVDTVSAAVFGQVLAVLGSGWLLLPRTGLHQQVVYVTAAAAGAAALGAAIVTDAKQQGWVAAVTGFIAGAGATVAGGAQSVPQSLVVAAAVGTTAAAMAVLVQSQPKATSSGFLAAIMAPISAVGFVAYAVAHLVAG